MFSNKLQKGNKKCIDNAIRPTIYIESVHDKGLCDETEKAHDVLKEQLYQKH